MLSRHVTGIMVEKLRIIEAEISPRLISLAKPKISCKFGAKRSEFTYPSTQIQIQILNFLPVCVG